MSDVDASHKADLPFKDMKYTNWTILNWVFLASSIKMTLKVPGTILAWSENSDPLCGPTMENERIFNTHHGSKRPIMDPLNHAFLQISNVHSNLSKLL